MIRLRLRRVITIGCLCALTLAEVASPCPAAETLTVVVMDPLAAPLACACVQGYAQRDYDRLGAFLEKQLGGKVEVVYSEDLAGALRMASGGADLIIGKQSLVQCDAKECRLKIRPLARLTDKRGATTLTGLFVVPSDDKAQSLADLGGYQVFFGPADSDEKNAAAKQALKKAGVEVSETIVTAASCSEAAFSAIDHEGPGGAAAVISSYAMAILEGCGTIDKGDLRVVGKTAPVPFVTVFAAESMAKETRAKVLDALLGVGSDRALLKALESKHGFRKVKSASTGDWSQWRGPRRDGISPWLPKDLSNAVKVRWRKGLTGAGLAGIAATDSRVIVADRDPADQDDVFRCLDADSGRQLWKLQYPAPGDLDYGNSPRATPLIHDEKVYLLGAFGDLHCVNLADGKVVWKTNLQVQFHAKLITWGCSASPLLVDGKLIVNPGGKEASLVALDPQTGEESWRCPGPAAAYSSFVVGRFGPRRQIVGYDAISIGGWDIETGRRLWKLLPPEEGDFNVPTPIAVDGKLLVTTENNGARLYAFDDQGKIVPKPVAENLALAPDTSTPVVIDGKVFGCFGELFCLDLNSDLKTLWTAEDEAFDDYVSIIGNKDRLLITTVTGELLLVRAGADRYELLSRVQLFDAHSEVLSHPAITGHRIYIRDTSTVRCLDFDMN